MNEFLKELELLNQYFGVWAFGIVGLAFLLMIPVNYLSKVLLKSEKMQRLRKTLSAISVYIISMIVVMFFTAVIARKEITLAYVLSTCVPVGFMAQVLWAITKFAKEYGIDTMLEAIAKSNEFKNALIGMGVDKKIVNLIETDIKNSEYKNIDEFLKEELEITKKIRTKLNGFIAENELDNAIKLCIKEIKKSIPEKKEVVVSVAKEV